MVGAAFVVMMIGFGVAYTFSAFFGPLSEEFGIDRGDTSTIFSIAGFLYFFLGAWSGPAADRIGAHPVVVFGTIVTALGLFLPLGPKPSSRSTGDTAWAWGSALAACMCQRWGCAALVRRETRDGLRHCDHRGIGVGTFAAPTPRIS